jgi:hypothetical protein
MEINVYELFDEMERLKKPLSDAEGALAGLEGSKNSIKSIMMKKSGEQSLGGQEREAYASKEFQDHNQKIAETTSTKALLKLEFAIAQMKFEAWRSEQATNRNIDRNAR